MKHVTINGVEFKHCHQYGYSGGQWTHVFDYWIDAEKVGDFEFNRRMYEEMSRYFSNPEISLNHGRDLAKLHAELKAR